MNKTVLLSLFLTLGFIACSKEEKNSSSVIAQIPEASGISFCNNSNSLVVANDEGSFYEINTKGDILVEHKLGKYDLEGVVCEKNYFIFAVEDGMLLKVNRDTLKSEVIKIKTKDFKFSKKSGIEAITKVGKFYYIAIQAKTKEDSYLLKLKIKNNNAKVKEIINHKIIDSAGMQFFNNQLFIISDKKNKLYLYDLNNNAILKKIKLPKFAQEGITFDNQNNIYFADDNGRVFKYLASGFGL